MLSPTPMKPHDPFERRIGLQNETASAQVWSSSNSSDWNSRLQAGVVSGGSSFQWRTSWSRPSHVSWGIFLRNHSDLCVLSGWNNLSHGVPQPQISLSKAHIL
jgi:hypothetical protein